MIPMSTTKIVTAANCEIPKSSGTLKIPESATPPEYNVTGTRFTTYSRRNRIVTRLRVPAPKRLSMKSGIVVMPCFRYRGTRNSATRIRTRPDVTSYPMTAMLTS